ncbi:MAG: T9SS type A sorting domain-containing protein [Ignavibacteria bacterium]|nr:T9SS type A sorting domain-containing protein [Ignavibacteria bacterium]
MAGNPIRSPAVCYAGEPERPGIFVSTNAGANWTATAFGWASADAQCLAFNPFGAGDGQLFAATGLGVYRSTDLGARWTKVSTGESVGAFAFSSDDAGATRIFAAISKGIVLSTDSGKTWKQSTMHQMPTNAVLVSEHDPVGNTVIAGGRDGVYRSTDNGASWFTTYKTPKDVTALAESVSGSPLFAGTDGSGMFVSAGVFEPWIAVNNGLGNLHVRCLAVSRTAGGGEFLFAGTDSGVYRSTNDGNQWTSTALTNARVRALVVFRDARGGSNLFAGIEGGDGGILLSTDQGNTWSSVGAGLGNASVLSLALTPEWMTPRRLFAGTASLRVWRRNVSDMVSTGIETSVVHPSPSDLSLSVYPNPARDRLQVRYDPRHIPGEIEMFTVLGVRVERASTNEAGVAVFDVNTLPTGLYVLRLRSAAGSVFRRVTILR